MTFYAQCYESVGASSPSDPGFVQFGQKDGVTYYYSAVGAAWTAAILTPSSPAVDGGPSDAAAVVDAGSDDAASAGIDAAAAVTIAPGGDYVVKAWSGVGYQNAASCGAKNGFDDCSYGVIRLEADSSKAVFEMSVAGIGFGYCGAQLKSDGANVYGTGSPDMGLTCGPPDTFCVAASDVTTPATCDPPLTTFALPALGRLSTTGPNAGGPGVDAGPSGAWAASKYPGSSNQVTLDGTTSDSLYFGPTAPTTGVSQF